MRTFIWVDYWPVTQIAHTYISHVLIAFLLRSDDSNSIQSNEPYLSDNLTQFSGPSNKLHNVRLHYIDDIIPIDSLNWLWLYKRLVYFLAYRSLNQEIIVTRYF